MAGVTGFSKVLTDVIPISLSLMVLIVNFILCAFGIFCVGKEFAAKTLAVSIIFPVMLEFFIQFPVNCNEWNAIACIITGGIMLGSGAGLILRSGASCEGFDIFAVILNKKFRFSIATVLNICDAIVILIQAFGNTPIQTLCGILVITISARVAGRAATLKDKGNMCADLSY